MASAGDTDSAATASVGTPSHASGPRPAAGTTAAPRGAVWGVQFKLLFTKALRTKAGHPFLTAFELVFPLYAVFIVWLVRSVDLVPSEAIATVATTYPVQRLNDSAAGALSEWRATPDSLIFAPSNDADAMAVAQSMCDTLGIDWLRVTKLETLDAVKQAAVGLSVGTPGPSAAVVVDVALPGVTLVHPDLDGIAQRMSAQRDVPGIPDAAGSGGPSSSRPPATTEEEAAVYGGFVLLQAVATEALRAFAARDAANSSVEPDLLSLSMQPFPVPAQLEVTNWLKIIFPAAFAMALVANFQAVLTEMSVEVERGIKEALTLKGMRASAYYASWFAAELVIVVPATTTVLMVGYAVNVFNSDAGFTILAFTGSALAGTAASLLAVVSFGRGVSSQKLYLVGLAILQVSMLTYYLVEYLMIDNDLPAWLVRITFLLWTVPISHILFRASDSELLGLSTPLIGQRAEHIEWAIAMLFVDAAVYLALTLLLDALNDTSLADRINSRELAGADSADGDAHVDKRSGIVLRGLRKEFRTTETVRDKHMRHKKKKVVRVTKAIDGVDVTIAPATVFCLVGHNGSGKTTMLRCLTGSETPTAGDGWVGGYHIVRDRTQLRRSLGVCPQQNVLHEELIVKDELMLFAGIAGMAPAAAAKEAERLLKALLLEDKAGSKVANLSGGQRRRVSLATALIGNPRVLLLDEPSTGCDPRNRRNIWHILKQLQHGAEPTTVIMTTHSMDEADALGDVVGVLSKGKLQAVATPLELKRAYGLGYHLHCVKAADNAGRDAPDHSDALLELLQRHVPGATLATNIGSDLSFALPAGETDRFPALFDELEASKAERGIESFGLSATTLEDVFLELERMEKTGKGASTKEHATACGTEAGPRASGGAATTADAFGAAADAGAPAAGSDDSQHRNSGDVAVAVDDDKTLLEPLECDPTMWRQLKAVLTQVMLQSTRYSFAIVYVAVVPVIMAIMAGAVSLAIKPSEPQQVGNVPSVVLARNGVVYAPDDAAALGLVGAALAEDAYRYSDPAAMIAAVEAASDAAVSNQVWGVPSLSAAVQFTGNSGASIGTAPTEAVVTFNQQRPWSARGTVQQLYDAMAEATGSTPVAVNYLQWRSTRGQNDFAVGGLTMFVAMIFAVLGGFYAEDSLRIRISGVKDMLLLAGLRRSVLWSAYFLSHFFLLLVSAGITLLVMLAFGMDGVSDNTFLAYFMLFVCFAPSIILSGYVMGFTVSSVEACQEGVAGLYKMSVFVPWVILTFVVEGQSVGAENVLSVIPGFALYRGFAILEAAAKNGTPFDAADVFDWDRQLAQAMVVMMCSAAVFGVILFVVDYGYWHKFEERVSRLTATGARATGSKSSSRTSGTHASAVGPSTGAGAGAASTAADVSVVATDDESGLPPIVSGALPLLADDDDGPVIHIDRVNKTFAPAGQAPVHAVRDVSLDVAPNSIFGLLGPNGAGKTALLSAITQIGGVGGRMDPGGDARVAGYSVQDDLEAARVFMGVCAQFDRLNEFLTAREHLRMLANVRGLPEDKVERVVAYYLDQLDLTPIADKQSGTYSGGNKRRLSVAMSMIGTTRAAFLDEPSTGMDPSTRRLMWRFVENVRRKRAVVLSTHAMDEADALCNRIGIMIRGGLRAVGSPQQLKNAHGRGYLVTMRRGSDRDAAAAGAALAASHTGKSGAEAAAEGDVSVVVRPLDTSSGNNGAGGKTHAVTSTGAGDADAEAKVEAKAEAAAPSTIDELMLRLSSQASALTDDTGLAIVRYSLPDARLSDIFQALQTHGEKLGVLDFTVSQVTLEQVFLSFVRNA